MRGFQICRRGAGIGINFSNKVGTRQYVKYTDAAAHLLTGGHSPAGLLGAHRHCLAIFI